jgi:hypothetical protein
MSFRFLPLIVALALVLAGVSPARAEESHDVWVLPTQPAATTEGAPDLTPLARRLDAVLQDAVRDFGMTPLLGQAKVSERDDAALTVLARQASVLSPEIGLHGANLELRLVMVSRGSEVLLVRVQRFDPADIEVRSLGMLRELLEPSLERARADCPPVPDALTPQSTKPSVRSEGRVVLALHAAVLGGYVGFSLQRASGSNDVRLTYPLTALGAAVGVGAAVIVADEWDIDVARAWFLGASMSWPGIGTLLLVNPDGPTSPGRRYLLGVLGSVGGVTLATAGLALGDVTEGGAALTHSGAAFGLLMGGLTEMMLQGDAQLTPRKGMGVGALSGVLLAGAVATQFDVPSSTDVLAIDLSALLGGLTGAALGTPVLVSQEASPTRDRIWLAGIMAGTIAGAGLSYWITQGDGNRTQSTSTDVESGTASPGGLSVRPQLGWMGTPFGLGVSGSW